MKQTIRIASLKLESLFCSFLFQVIICLLIFALYHLIVDLIGIQLGSVGPSSVPLYINFIPHVSLYGILPIIVFFLFLAFCKHIVLKFALSETFVILLVICFVLLMNISVAMMDGGLNIISGPFDRTGVEYFGDVMRVENLGHFLRDYVEILPSLSQHSGTHPPGAVLFLWFVAQLFGDGSQTAAFSAIFISALSLIPAYLLAKNLYGQETGNLMLGLYVVTPNLVLFGATSMDGVFAFFLLLVILAFYYAFRNENNIYAVLAGIMLALGTLFTFATICIVVFFTAYASLRYLYCNSNWELFKLLLIAALVFVLFYLVFYLTTGYHLLENLIWSIEKDKNQVGTGYESISLYFLTSMSNLMAFLLGTGISTTVLWVREVIKNLPKKVPGKEVDFFVISSAISIIILSFSTLFTLEVERIWMFLSPLLVIIAARHVNSIEDQTQKFRFLYLAMSVLFLQTWGMELLFYTYW